MSWIRISCWFFLTSFILMFGCQGVENRSETSQSSAVDANSSFEVNFLGEEQLRNLIEKRDGRILFINVWASWCIPCREEFPDLVRLSEKYKDKNIDMVAISADYPDEIESKIIPFLESQQVNFPVYVQNFDKQEDFINFLNVDWSGALPATFVYNAAGEQKQFLLGKQSYNKFTTVLENEL